MRHHHPLPSADHSSGRRSPLPRGPPPRTRHSRSMHRPGIDEHDAEAGRGEEGIGLRLALPRAAEREQGGERRGPRGGSGPAEEEDVEHADRRRAQHGAADPWAAEPREAATAPRRRSVRRGIRRSTGCGPAPTGRTDREAPESIPPRALSTRASTIPARPPYSVAEVVADPRAESLRLGAGGAPRPLNPTTIEHAPPVPARIQSAGDATRLPASDS